MPRTPLVSRALALSPILHLSPVMPQQLRKKNRRRPWINISDTGREIAING